MVTVEIYNKEKGRYICVYADFVACRRDSGLIEAISFSGIDSSVQAIKAAVWKKQSLYISYKYFHVRNNYRTVSEKTDEYTHVVMYSSDVNNPKADTPVIFIKDEKARAKAVYDILCEKFNVPLIEEWMDWIEERMIMDGFLEELSIMGNKEVKGYRIVITENNLLDIVRSGLQKKRIKINGKPSIDLENITMAEYLKKYSAIFAERIEKKFKPIYNPVTEKPLPAVNELKRKPFKAQADVIMGAVRALDKQKSVIIVGEMGTGKTLIGASIPYVQKSGRNYAALVMCPGHLVEKWRREIEMTVPNSEAVILHSWKDIMKITKQDKTIYYIISRDKAKLGYNEKTAVIEHDGKVACPDCGRILKDKDDIPLTMADFITHNTRNNKCPYCKTKLWQADNKGVRRYAVSEYVKKHMKNFFDYFIADEVHELKSGDTAQGNTFGTFASACKKTIALTGTLLGGYASDIFYILYRLNPKAQIEDGIKYDELGKFIERYGAVETTIKTDIKADYNKSSKGRKERKTKRQLPVVSPLIFSKCLLSQCIFLQLSDLQQSLPKYEEVVKVVKPDTVLKNAYDDLQDALKNVVYANLKNGQKSMLSTYLMTLLRYPDKPFGNEKIIVNEETGYGIDPQILSEEIIYNKEQYLLNYVLEEVQKGRNVYVYAQFTGTKDITGRLEKLLNDVGVKTCTLKSSVKQEVREEWLTQKVKDGYKCIISNYDLVKTGLDLIDFPTIIFYETGYSTYTLRQAGRRSWRIGQKNPVKVIYMVYENTLQYNALALMGNKLEAAMNIEGKFSEEGLRSLANNSNMLVELAKSLVNGLNPNISIEAVWRKEQTQKEVSGIESVPDEAQTPKTVSLTDFFTVAKVMTGKKKKSGEVEQLCIDFEKIFAME